MGRAHRSASRANSEPPDSPLIVAEPEAEPGLAPDKDRENSPLGPPRCGSVQEIFSQREGEPTCVAEIRAFGQQPYCALCGQTFFSSRLTESLTLSADIPRPPADRLTEAGWT